MRDENRTHCFAPFRQPAGEQELHAKVMASIREWRSHLEELLEVARTVEMRLLATKPGLRDGKSVGTDS
jgi:hypothetical protein